MPEAGRVDRACRYGSRRNPNQLRRWIARYQPQILHGSQEPDPMVVDGVSIDICAPPVKDFAKANTLLAFVPVVPSPLPPSMVATPIPSMTLALHVRLTNGVELSFNEAGVEEITTIIQLLGRLPCSGLTKA